MEHGSLFKKADDFRKIVPETAPHLDNAILVKLAALMGPSDLENTNIPAGWTYFGQFVDHDLTFTKNEVNLRSPELDLDSVYGEGPGSAKHGHIFDSSTPGKDLLKVGNARNADGDLFRNQDSVAEIPDRRNDENIVVASVHLLFQKLHNKFVQDEGLTFEKAKRMVVWHYQSIVINDFLRRIVGSTILDRILQAGRVVYTPQNPGDIFMPTEFSGACYRFGHSMVREAYSFNDNFRNTSSHPHLFFKFPNGRPKPGIQGSHQITKVWSIQGNGQSLRRFFDPSILDPTVDASNLSGLVDAKLPTVLFNLEVQPGENNILAHRNLVSGQLLKLGNGQQVASFLATKGVPVVQLTDDEIALPNIPVEVISNTPLWYYILREAEVQESGKHLGEVGGTIVGETIVGLLQVDPQSFIHPTNENEDWDVDLSVNKDKNVKMLDVIDYIG